MSVERYNARAAEIHWQTVWYTENVFTARNDDPRPRYALNQSRCIPLDRLGHIRSCTMGDVVARYKRARGFVVLYPGDAFGMAAKDTATAMRTGSNIGATKAQLQSMGLSLDWSRESDTCDSASDQRPPAVDPASIEIDLDDVIDTYGADAARWFLLSDSPPDRDVIWSENGIHGAWRFVHRLWRLINSARIFSQGAPSARPQSFPASALDLRRRTHRTLAQVSGNIERTRFNLCVAHIYAFARNLEAVVTDSSEPASAELKFAAREAAEMMVQLFHPMMPHLAEECWAALGHASLLAIRNWPTPEADLLQEDAVRLPVHVNGRRRADVTVARDARNGDIEASVLALDVIRRALDGRTPRKVIIVPQRIINVVA
jgi:leucyl-tRNA synthetase